MKTIIQKKIGIIVFFFFAFALPSCQKEQVANATKDVQLHSTLSSATAQKALANFQITIAAQKISQTDYIYLLGEEFIEGPDKAVAPNGDVVSLIGSGTLSIHSKSVTGSGEFTHSNGSGIVLGSGSWSAEQLLSFHSYGNSAPAVPAELEGGRALIRIHLSPKAGGAGFDAILQIDCLLGNPPPGAFEGIRLDVQGVINFNKAVSGETVFIRQ